MLEKIIARGDELTDARLATVKAIVRRELASAGFGFGVFQSKPASSTDSDDEEEDDNKTQTDGNNIDKGEDFDTYDGESAVLPSEPSEVSQRGPDLVVDAPEDEDVEATHDIPGSLSSTQKPPRPPRSPSRSRSAVQSRKPVRPSDSTGFIEESSDDVNSYVSSSSSSEDGAAAALEPLLPFCLISPEVDPARHKRHSEGQRFLRKFRWGEVDVLDPKHCDFEPLKAAILGSHMEKLKSSTRQLVSPSPSFGTSSRRLIVHGSTKPTEPSASRAVVESRHERGSCVGGSYWYSGIGYVYCNAQSLVLERENTLIGRTGELRTAEPDSPESHFSTFQGIFQSTTPICTLRALH